MSVRVARMSVRVAIVTPVVPTPEPAEPAFDEMVGVVVGFEHVITPGRWISTLHTTTSTRSY